MSTTTSSWSILAQGILAGPTRVTPEARAIGTPFVGTASGRFSTQRQLAIYLLERRSFPPSFSLASKLVPAILRLAFKWVDLGLFTTALDAAVDARDVMTDLNEEPRRVLAKGGRTPPDEFGLAWRAVDHSNPTIRWEPVCDPDLIDVLKTVVARYITPRPFTFYDRLYEGTATRNFRVCAPGMDPFFLKLHLSGVTPLQIQSARRLSKVICDADIFDPWFAAGLQARQSRDHKELSEFHPGLSWLAPQGLQTVSSAEAFPLIDGVAHFDGNDEEQLTSFALKLGEVQSALRASQSGLLDYSYQGITYAGTGRQLEREFRVQGVVFEHRRQDDNNPAIPLWHQHNKYIRKTLKRITPFLDRSFDYGIFLHDIHPHNAMFNGSNCALIYDYDLHGYFPHGEVLAYAVHRFVRERVRILYFQHGHAAHESIARLVDIFLDAYARYGPPIPMSIRVEIADWIRVSALRKLASTFGKFAFNQDRAGRDQEKLLEELLKFLAYLYEADFFEAALHPSV